MFSYSVLGCAFILSCMGLYRHRENYLEAADNLVYTGVAFLTIGMLTGAIWAKAAWGHYWSWDPKKLGLLLPGRDICCIYICGYSDVRLHVHCIGS